MEPAVKELDTSVFPDDGSKDCAVELQVKCDTVGDKLREKKRSSDDPSGSTPEEAAVNNELSDKSQPNHSVIPKTDTKTESTLQIGQAVSIDCIHGKDFAMRESGEREAVILNLKDSSQFPKDNLALAEVPHISCSSTDENSSSVHQSTSLSTTTKEDAYYPPGNDESSTSISGNNDGAVVPYRSPSHAGTQTSDYSSSLLGSENNKFTNSSDTPVGGNSFNTGVESTSTVSFHKEAVSACDDPSPISPKETDAAVAALMSGNNACSSGGIGDDPSTCMQGNDDLTLQSKEGEVDEDVMDADDSSTCLKIVSVLSQQESTEEGGTLSSKPSDIKDDLALITEDDKLPTNDLNKKTAVKEQTTCSSSSNPTVVNVESLNTADFPEVDPESHQINPKSSLSRSLLVDENILLLSETLADGKLGSEEKSMHETNKNEEVCIVPDTEPRVPSDKEKADAVQKANEVSHSIEGENSGSGCGKHPCAQKDSSETSGLQGNEMSTDVGDIDKSTPHGSMNRKFGIQLVSTSSLVSRQDSLEKEQCENNHVLSGKCGEQTCTVCAKTVKCKYHLNSGGEIFICDDDCYNNYKKTNESHVPKIRPRKLDNTFDHECGQCSKAVDPKLEKSLGWETMDFCSEECLEKYQKTLGSHCANCKGTVLAASLGKYCVRFGYDMKQFCSAHCLEDFKKGLKVCSYCQKDISRGAQGFLAPVGDKGQFKDFCSQECMEKYDQMSHNTSPPEVHHDCAVCNEVKAVKVEVLLDFKVHKLCSEPCFAAFKFVNNIVADKCDMCKKYYDHNRSENFTVFYDDSPHSFCCKTCMNVYILAKRKIVPCSWCKVKKYNFDMIKKSVAAGQNPLMFCSLHCLKSFQIPHASSAPSKKVTCDLCNSTSPSQYHLTMSDASVRSFCSSNCVMSFQGKFSKTAVSVQVDKSPFPLGLPRKIVGKKTGSINASIADIDQDSTNSSGSLPVISSVTSLAPTMGPMTQQPPSPLPISPTAIVTSQIPEIVKTVYKQQLIVRPPLHPAMANCAVQVKPKSTTKSVSCRPQTSTIGTQTDDSMIKPIFIPVPVPIFIPAPMRMYSSPYPVPVPITLPIPVPIFIPTTKNSADGILKEIKRIQEKIPSDPFEAELLMMAEMVASEKKSENTDSDSEGVTGSQNADDNDTGITAESISSSENVDTNSALNDDVLHDMLSMASQLDEPTVDFVGAVTPTVVAQTPTTEPHQEKKNESDEGMGFEQASKSAGKRPLTSSLRSSNVNAKRGRKSSSSDALPSLEPVYIKEEPVERPDAHLCLKFTLGVNAWKNWVSHKNADLEKAEGSSKKLKPFKPALLELTADELNYSLCLFVKEVRKPNGQEYSPDTVYYLCLGIQQYLVENGRIENIFSDPYYENFTNCLDDLAKQFSPFCPETQCLMTRVEEEHLWESKQLGAHSPFVLLNTLMFFNTKHFNLMTVEEHRQLSFSHIMKHWKRPPSGSASAPIKSRNIVLRFYPPQSALANNSKKKKVYEQDENEDTPLKCPVKLYEFYLSKCPESVKTRNDVFYLLPERSCVPDSPVWYSTMPLGHDQLQKMLHRIKMVKEIIML